MARICPRRFTVGELRAQRNLYLYQEWNKPSNESSYKSLFVTPLFCGILRQKLYVLFCRVVVSTSLETKTSCSAASWMTQAKALRQSRGSAFTVMLVTFSACSKESEEKRCRNVFLFRKSTLEIFFVEKTFSTLFAETSSMKPVNWSWT